MVMLTVWCFLCLLLQCNRSSVGFGGLLPRRPGSGWQHLLVRPGWLSLTAV
jgi:hypothetical protein